MMITDEKDTPAGIEFMIHAFQPAVLAHLFSHVSPSIVRAGTGATGSRGIRTWGGLLETA